MQRGEPEVLIAADFDVAGYYLSVDGVAVRPANGIGVWDTRGEALAAWEAARESLLGGDL